MFSPSKAYPIWYLRPDQIDSLLLGFFLTHSGIQVEGIAWLWKVICDLGESTGRSKKQIIDLVWPNTIVSRVCPWALKCNLRFRPSWVLTQDINSMFVWKLQKWPLQKFGTWAVTREWVIARDTTVLHVYSTRLAVYLVCNSSHKDIHTAWIHWPRQQISHLKKDF